MRSFSTVTGLGLLGLMAGCSTSQGPLDHGPSTSGDDLVVASPTFVTLTTPKCGKGICPEYYAQAINEKAAPQAIGNLDFSQTTFSKGVIADITSAPASQLVLRGTIGPMPKSGFPTFAVTEAYRAQDAASYDGASTFYQGGDYDPPPPCAKTTTCPEGRVAELNTTTSATYDAIAIDPAANAKDPDYLKAQIAAHDAVVAGVVATEIFGTRSRTTLTASRVFVKMPFAGEGIGRLSVNDSQIIDPSGRTVVLRGWNWGQWGSYQDGDAVDNVAQGATVVRIILRWWGGYGTVGSDPAALIDSWDANAKATGYIESSHLDALDAMVQHAAAKGLWIDLAIDSDCGQGSLQNDTPSACGTAPDGSANNFANDPGMAEKFAQAWEFLARRYQDQPYIGMLEVLPEPHLSCPSNKTCTDYTAAPRFYAPIVQRIRAIDPVTPILLGPTGGYDIKNIATADLSPYYPTTGLIYTGDLLDNAAQDPANVQPAVDFRDAAHVPVFIQQVGVREGDSGSKGTANKILQALANQNIGWTWWTYREMKSAGGGYAPYFKTIDATEWSSDEAWLTTITKSF